ncbi:MAG: glycoside hydrolase family 125 protein, partial [Actinomycetota bacterium]
ALVASHLRWLWTRCERPEGRWARSHLPSGATKDRGLQADQQLYPLLELCDYRTATGALPELRRDAAGGWDELVTEAWAALPVHEDVGLLAGEENPADEPLELPYLVSNQILWWTTSVRLRELQAVTGIARGIDFRSVGESVRTRVRQHFCAPGPASTQWAYATDARGATALYNDANDLPTAFAPLLGFCTPADDLWRATMEFTFGPDNAAYCPGAHGGLGSVHTPGTWPLGDIQEWVAFSLMGQRERAARALRRLVEAATSDGMFPEAYDPDSGRLAARHWFAWPGAVLGALYLGGVPGRTRPDS